MCVILFDIGWTLPFVPAGAFADPLIKLVLPPLLSVLAGGCFIWVLFILRGLENTEELSKTDEST
jgi:hypothetical protein